MEMYKGISMLFVLLLYVFDIFRSVLTNYKMILLLSIQFHGFRLQKDQDATLKRDDEGFIILQWKNDIPKKLRS